MVNILIYAKYLDMYIVYISGYMLNIQLFQISHCALIFTQTAPHSVQGGLAYCIENGCCSCRREKVTLTEQNMSSRSCVLAFRARFYIFLFNFKGFVMYVLTFEILPFDHALNNSTPYHHLTTVLHTTT